MLGSVSRRIFLWIRRSMATRLRSVSEERVLLDGVERSGLQYFPITLNLPHAAFK